MGNKLKRLAKTGLSLMAGLVALSLMATSGQTEDGFASKLVEKQRHFARQQLIAAVRLYDEHMRVPETGQYLDYVDLTRPDQVLTRSSIASTGIGLISLTIGDRLGEIDHAAQKAITTLENLLGRGGTGFDTPRSQNGWYKHFVDAHTGKTIADSEQVFSTIDTAILGVGTHFVASYFSTKEGEKAQKAAALARELLNGVHWPQAIRFRDNPGIHQVFHGHEEVQENRHWSLLFDEYVILPCLGRAQEAAFGQPGRATRFWDVHVEDAAKLPQKEFHDLSVLGPVGLRFTSHFTHQFAYYFCRDLAEKPAFQSEFNEVKLADKKWFSSLDDGKYPTHWWGQGAGSEIKFKQASNEIEYSGYGVNHIENNPHRTISPAIMAGFLPTEAGEDEGKPSDILADLMTLHARDECRYRYEGLDFLWRCPARDSSLRVEAVEGIDFSTYMLGLAWYDEAVGADFFKTHAVQRHATPWKTN